MQALGLDYKTYFKNKAEGDSETVTRPEAILSDDVYAETVDFICDTFREAFKAGARLFTPNTAYLHDYPDLDDEKHARILRAQIKTLRKAFKACLERTVGHPEIFLWAATYLPHFSNSERASEEDIFHFHTVQAEVAKEEDMRIYYGTIGSEREALLAAKAAHEADLVNVTIGLVIDTNGKLLHDKIPVSDVVQKISTLFPGVTVGFDNSTLSTIDTALTDLRSHQLNGVVTALFPYIDQLQAPWTLTDRFTEGNIGSISTTCMRLLDIARKNQIERVGWAPGHRIEHLTELTRQIRGSSKIQVAQVTAAIDNVPSDTIPAPFRPEGSKSDPSPPDRS